MKELDLEKIQALIKFVARSGVTEVDIDTEGFKISIKTPPKKRNGVNEQEPTYIQTQVPMGISTMQAVPQVQMQSSAPNAAADAAKSPAADKNADMQDIKSPMIGTFYRSASPEKPPFVNVGDIINKGDVVCIIEAMKLFNEIESEVSGKIVKVLVDDSSPVEYDQPLILVEPA